ncbi:hypothetical protein SNOG_04221 [Parastagonospora nodorum SN15]|uniref:Uncharacterized protein n=1 Tax=Phaeosphaeria nodorum (strain SN15 / ATCC MYA-4574 / FGSC 10173) TaxID=321614 RepID=Q0UVJ3_PHANO|nr:hypothetical protein SNOG_04221 [Parastagonospora nodorum SN15]EAT87981.1 hypothetical protein SNOG_04221 [Parastagonospora nodorum SN15]
MHGTTLSRPYPATSAASNDNSCPCDNIAIFSCMREYVLQLTDGAVPSGREC